MVSCWLWQYFYFATYFFFTSCLSVPVRSTVQPSGQGSSPEMVPGLHAEGEEENPARVGCGDSGPTLQNVQRPGVQGN